MEIVSVSSDLKPIPRKGRSHCRFGTVELTLLSVCHLLSWVVAEWCWLQREQHAAAILKQNYGASAQTDVFVSGPAIDPRELWRGRLYHPVVRVAIDGAALDDGMWEQLRRFRYLQSLTFTDCRIEPCAGFPIDTLSRLRYLTFSRTTLTIDNVRTISRLRHLESLTLNATGLKGDWLQPLSALPKLKDLELRNADLTEVTTASLAHMKRLTTLQLSAVKINSELWSALAELGELENLVIVKTPFDDGGMRYLAGPRKLQILYLDSAAISDVGVESLAQLPNLWRLSLAGTNVGDAGLRHLSQLPRLAALDIRFTRATNACLCSLASMPALKMALVEGTDINPSAPGFVGVCNSDGSVWYPNEARRKEIEDDSKLDACSADERGTPR
ncbi:leucine-rich repeat domain-containing protein [Thermopirellula anaerolimosa]